MPVLQAAALRVHVPGGFLVQEVLVAVDQLPRDDFAVDWVGDTDGAVQGDEPQVANVVDVVVRYAAGGRFAAQHGLHDAPHAVLAQLVRELIQVSIAAQNELLAGVLDGVSRYRPALVQALVSEAGLVGERIHQPRLALGERPDCLAGVLVERLSRLPGVLRKQGFHFIRREIAQPQGFGLDVEGAAAGDDGVLGRRLDAVVAHVSNAAQDDALRKA